MSVVVGLDTSTPATSVAVLIDGGPAVERGDDGERPRHAQTLLPLLEAALEEARRGWDEVERICVGTGPGGFTGLRLGIASARALAQGRGLPLVPVSSLEALAAAAGTENVLAAIDARRGEVFAAVYRAGALVLGPAALAPQDLAARLAPGLVGVGDGAVRYREALERAGVAVPAGDAREHRVSALMVCRLGRDREPVEREALLPDYRREPDAVPPSPS